MSKRPAPTLAKSARKKSNAPGTAAARMEFDWAKFVAARANAMANPEDFLHPAEWRLSMHGKSDSGNANRAALHEAMQDCLGEQLPSCETLQIKFPPIGEYAEVGPCHRPAAGFAMA